MIATSTSHSTAPLLVAPLPKVRSVFTGSTGPSLQFDYNGALASFRIQVNNSRRLFFFEQDVFQKVQFKNEYGVTIGQLAFTRPSSGVVKMDEKRYRFHLTQNNSQLILPDLPVGEAPFTLALTDAQLAELDAAHKKIYMCCLVFAFVFALNRY
jgi:hypothetical protein